MKVLLFGASGMVGQGVLRECLQAPDVERVVSVVRSPSGRREAKLVELLRPDVTDLAAASAELRDVDACFFCLGTSAAGMSEAAYATVTYDLTLAVARTLLALRPTMTFVYVSGQGTDSTERGRVMWARVKGRTENALRGLGFGAAYMFRPGLIIPLHGIRSRTSWYNAIYTVLAPVALVLRKAFPQRVLTTEQVGRAMLAVARNGFPRPVLESPDIASL